MEVTMKTTTPTVESGVVNLDFEPAVSSSSMRIAGRLRNWALVISCLALIASGCATAIGVNYVDRGVAYRSLTANVLSADQPSSFSARELMNRNLSQRFEDDPAKALAELHANLASEGDEDLLFALAELSFFHAENSGDRSYYLAAAVYAYAFLLPGQHGTPPRPIDPRARWAVDLYNQSLTQAAKSPEGAYAIPMGARSNCPSASLRSLSTKRI